MSSELALPEFFDSPLGENTSTTRVHSEKGSSTGIDPSHVSLSLQPPISLTRAGDYDAVSSRHSELPTDSDSTV